jgi:hypothetical protein
MKAGLQVHALFLLCASPGKPSDGHWKEWESEMVSQMPNVPSKHMSISVGCLSIPLYNESELCLARSSGIANGSSRSIEFCPSGLSCQYTFCSWGVCI